MFNLSGSEIVVILLLALVILGPEKLPDAIRKFGKTYAEFKRTASGFQSEFRSALDEPMREMRETADMIRKSADFTADDPPDTKPVTQQMAPADADAPTRNDGLRAADDPPHDEPTTDVPFSSGDVPDEASGQASGQASDLGPSHRDIVEVDPVEPREDGSDAPGEAPTA